MIDAQWPHNPLLALTSPAHGQGEGEPEGSLCRTELKMIENASVESYPSRDETDAWPNSIWELVDSTRCEAELLADQGFTDNLGVRHTPGFQ